MTAPSVLPADFTSFPHGFPTRENCDPTNPYQAFLWMLVAMPYMKGAQLVLPVDYLQFVSKRLWDCGVRPVEEPTIKYQKPAATDPNWLTSPGSWVDVDTPDRDPVRPVEAVVDSLLNQQQAELMKELWSRMTPKQRQQLTDSNDIT
jgi:hypothetical protein